MFLQQLRQSLLTLGLPARAHCVLVAVSGGADSVALLVALRRLAPRLGLQLKAAHLHHGLRGAAADADARFVRALARRLKVPCVVGRVQVAALARQRGVSIEMAAREARYAFLVETAQQWAARAGPVAIATAHQANDQAETVLLRLARGAGPRGLAGIPPERSVGGVRIVRPLLGVWRREIEAFLRAARQPWREDLSNADRAMLRNRVRHEVLPLMCAALNPRAAEALVRTADLLREDEAWMDGVARSLIAGLGHDDGTLDAAALAALPKAARRRLIRLWLADRGCAPETLEFRQADAVDALAARHRSGGAVGLEGGRRVVRRGLRLIVVAPAMAPAAGFTAAVKIPGVTHVPEAGIVVRAGIGKEIVRERGRTAGALPAKASLSRRRLGRRRLVVRSWQPGDRIAPMGMAGSQKLQDVFVNAKVPAARRHRIPVFACGREIVWIPGHRVARGWEIRDARDPILELAVERG